MFHDRKMVMSKGVEDERKGDATKQQWRVCGGGVNHSLVHGRGKTRFEHQRFCAGVLHHTSGHGRGVKPKNSQWYDDGVVNNKVKGRGKTYPEWCVVERMKKMSIKNDIPSIDELMMEDAEAREEDIKF